MTGQRNSPRPHPVKSAARRNVVQAAARQAQFPAQNIAPSDNSGQDDPAEYAPHTALHTAKDSASAAGTAVRDTAITSYQKFRIVQQRLRHTQDGGGVPVREPAEHLSGITVLPPDQRRRNTQKTKYRQIAVSRRKATASTIQEPIITQKPNPKKDLFRRQLFQREAVLRYLKKQTRRTAPGTLSGGTMPSTAVPSMPSGPIPRLPGTTVKQQALDQLRFYAARFTIALRNILVSVARKALESLVALVGAGGIVLLIALVLGAAAAVIGSPMGILFANESGDPSSIPISQIVQETNREFGEEINEIVTSHPECRETEMHYEYEDGHSWASYWPEVLAVFAVHHNLNQDENVIVIDENSREQIKDTFWTMHQIEYEIEEIEVIPEQPEEPEEPEPEEATDPTVPEEPEEPPQPVIEYILHITVSSKSVEELAEEYHFTSDQRDILNELLSDSMRPTLLSLCGGLTGDGTIQWPLPGHSSISCHFGEVDAFGRAGHNGIDIPAAEGTPVLAAHNGTVMAAGWNDSYGNQILLDDGAGLSSRYDHMIATAVIPGEPVTAGQVIGFVGSTGDSTGNHLHFEVLLAGARIDPLTVVQP